MSLGNRAQTLCEHQLDFRSAADADSYSARGTLNCRSPFQILFSPVEGESIILSLVVASTKSRASARIGLTFVPRRPTETIEPVKRALKPTLALARLTQRDWAENE